MGTTNLLDPKVLGLSGAGMISLRPEALRIDAEAPAGWPRLSGTVAHVEILGPITRFDVRLGNGALIRGRSTRRAASHAGDRRAR
jgi:hypothetical protein